MPFIVGFMTIQRSSLKILRNFFILIQAILIAGPSSGVGAEATKPEAAMRPVSQSYPIFYDDMEFEHLALAIQRNFSYLKKLDPGKMFAYGPHQFSCKEVLETQEAFLDLISQRLTLDQFNEAIRKQFRIYQVAGQSETHRVRFTGCYEPIFQASLERDDTFKYPIYKKPDDLTRIDLSPYNTKYLGESIVVRFKNNRILPYYTRHQIEAEKALSGKNLEIAWLKDPFDAYILHIEGAGQLKLSSGKTIHLSYHASNGRSYRSLVKFFIDNGHSSLTEMSIQNMRRYLSSHPEVLDKLQIHNESFIFFKQVEEGPLGCINVPLTEGRSLALDTGLFPKGALAYMSSRKPLVNDQGEVTGSTEFSRFVINQDTGLVIKGADRANLFWGNGPEAESLAWHFNNDGELYVLIKNP